MQELRPGQWPDISGDRYQYLVGLARRHLVGCEHHAEDVVTQAMSKWITIPQDHPSARIETVIRSEAHSLVRSEGRRRRREERVGGDRSTHGLTWTAADELQLQALRQELVRTAKRLGCTVSTTDIEVIELLLAGHNLAEVALATGLPRHKVKTSRKQWQRIVRATFDGQDD